MVVVVHLLGWRDIIGGFSGGELGLLDSVTALLSWLLEEYVLLVVVVLVVVVKSKELFSV